jgi:ABC-type multidrug transport system ATPase subunit
MPNIVFTFTGCHVSVYLFSRWTHWFQHLPFFRNWGTLKSILCNVSGHVRGGEILAIMGPSGSGKSTLLKLLTLALTGGSSLGSIELNGCPLNCTLFQQHCAYVPQHDHLHPFLTCRQAIEFAVDFHMAFSPKKEKKARVDGLLRDLGLEACQHVMCEGLSGGQKRRLSVAIALSKAPAILFLDEPTSGLDSAAAAELVAFLQRVKSQRGVIIICTIHQPSSRVFNEFDSLLLLSAGQVVYFGPTSEAASYFTDAGHQPPTDVSLSEHILDIVNGDFGGEEKRTQVQRLLQQWTVRARIIVPPAIVNEALPRNRNEAGSSAARFVQHCKVHFRRQFLVSVRDPMLYHSRMWINLVACLLFATVYVEARQRNQEQVTNRMFLTAWMISVPTSMGIIAVYCYNQEFGSVRREVKDGMYSVFSYLVVNALLQVPFMVFLSLFALGAGAYGLADFRREGFKDMLFAFSAAMWAFEMIAQTYSVVFSNPLAGMLVFNLTWFTSFLFAGFVVVGESIPWPLRGLLYASPLRWAIAAMVKTEFRGAEFAGANLVIGDGGNGSMAAGFVCDIPPTARQVRLRTPGHDGGVVI